MATPKSNKFFGLSLSKKEKKKKDRPQSHIEEDDENEDLNDSLESDKNENLETSQDDVLIENNEGNSGDCGVCKTNEEGEWLQCGCCKSWFHFECLGLNAMLTLGREMVDKINWYCDECGKVFSSSAARSYKNGCLADELESLYEKNIELEKQIDNVRKEYVKCENNLKIEVEKLKSKIEDIKKAGDDPNMQMVNYSMNDLRDVVTNEVKVLKSMLDDQINQRKLENAEIMKKLKTLKILSLLSLFLIVVVKILMQQN